MFSGTLARLQLRVSLAHSAQRVGYASGASVNQILDAELEGIREAGTWKAERIINTKQAPTIGVAGREEKLLNFCANNYLGLSVSFGVFTKVENSSRM